MNIKKSQLKKKISIFLQNEFPLLLQSSLLDLNDLQDYINNINTLPELGKGKIGDKITSKVLNSYFELLLLGSSFCKNILEVLKIS